jgi:hypothetical protein
MASGSLKTKVEIGAGSAQSVSADASSAKLALTIDGRELDTYSEDYRRYCEAQHMFKAYRTKKTRQAALARIEKARGEPAMLELRAEMFRLWKHQQSAV